MHKISAYAAMIAAIAGGTPAMAAGCPKDLDAATRLVAGLRKTEKVDMSGCMWGCSEKYRYDTPNLNILGTTPLNLETSLIEGRISQIIFRLPGMPGQYIAPFRTAFAKASCSDSDHDDYDSCEWKDGREKVPFGGLEDAQMNLTIYEKNVTYLYCDYEVIG